VTAPKTLVKVTIGGEEYSLRSDRPLEYTRAVAEHVNQALKEIQSGGGMVETHKAAILAALAITDELFQARQTSREMGHRLTALAADLSRLLPPAKRASRASGGHPGSSEDTP